MKGLELNCRVSRVPVAIDLEAWLLSVDGCVAIVLARENRDATK